MKTYDIDEDTPLIPEIVAEQLTQDSEQQVRLCARARRHWRENSGFRRSFRRKDERDVLAMWFRHWMESEAKATR